MSNAYSNQFLSFFQMYSPLEVFDGRYFHQEMAKLRNPESFKATVLTPSGNANVIDTATSSTNRPTVSDAKGTRNDRLPVDDYREEILRKVRSDRVVIIHGETGCGKSSRIPVGINAVVISMV